MRDEDDCGERGTRLGVRVEEDVQACAALLEPRQAAGEALTSGLERLCLPRRALGGERDLLEGRTELAARRPRRAEQLEEADDGERRRRGDEEEGEEERDEKERYLRDANNGS
jgi:hypothetical protein